MFYSDVCRYKIVFLGSIVRSGNRCSRVNTEKSSTEIIIVKKPHVELVVSRNAMMSPINELVTELFGSKSFTRWLTGRESVNIPTTSEWEKFKQIQL